MITNIKDYSFEEVKSIILRTLNENPDYIQRLYEVCDKFDCLVKHIITIIENEEFDRSLSDIDMINAIRINQILPFFMLEDKYENLHTFCNAYILLIQNFIYLTGDKNIQLEESISVVAKLLRTELNFSRLIYVSEMLINRYELSQKKAYDSEGYKMSKIYIDKILKNKEDE